MQRLPALRDIINLFPWGRTESDGSTSHDLALARHNVLGASVEKVGYWAQPGGQGSHDLARSASPLAVGDKSYAGHGYILLSQLPNERVGWKLQGSKMIPRLFFDDEVEPPKVPGTSIVDWKSWYEWRRISLKSPVALLMDYPMSVYWLLVHVLKVVPLETLASFPTERRKLSIHYLGAERELIFLPIFSELALLIPNTDIEITFFGAAVRALVLRAKSTNPRAPAALPVPYSYRAPNSLGGSTFTAKLFSQADDWPNPPTDAHDMSVPDVAVALNAGIASYPTWKPPLLNFAALGIPFGITEYAEQSLDRAIEVAKGLRAVNRQHQLKQNTGADLTNFEKAIIGPIELNPFMRPGQRALSMMYAPPLPPSHFNSHPSFAQVRPECL
ncbi:hypothetical protein P7C70_g4718, partial [Phenoliferia sp. Uapishka_3]